MPTEEQQAIIDEHKALVIGAVIEDLEVTADSFGAMCTRLKASKNGDEFMILPFNWEHIHIEQVLWGNE